MGRKHQRRPGAAAASAAAHAAAPPGQGPLPASPAVPDPPAALLPYHSAGLAVRAAAGLPGRVAQFLDVLRLGVFALLGSSTSARLARAAHVLRAVIDALAAEKVVTQLRGTCVLQDAPGPRERPLLALSHLESLARSQLLFEAARELLRRCGSEQRAGVLLEVGGEDELCEALLGVAFPEAASRSSALARLAALLFHFRPPRRGAWPPQLLRALAGRGGAEPRALGGGGALATYLRGAASVLPATRAAAQAAAAGKAPVAAPALCRLFCQLLERLVYPPAEALVALRLSCPVDAGGAPAAEASSVVPPTADADIGPGEGSAEGEGCSVPVAAGAAAEAEVSQAQEFLDKLRELEREALPPTFDPFDVWVLESGSKYYIVLLE